MALQEKSKWSLANQSINYSKLVFFLKKKKNQNKTFIIHETSNNICNFSMSQQNRNSCVYFTVIVKIKV